MNMYMNVIERAPGTTVQFINATCFSLVTLISCCDLNWNVHMEGMPCTTFIKLLFSFVLLSPHALVAGSGY